MDREEELIRLAELKIQHVYLQLKEKLKELNKLILQIKELN